MPDDDNAEPARTERLLASPFGIRRKRIGDALQSREGFLLFRVLDVIKPFPARRLETLHGGAGIMADDLCVAVYANLLLQVALRAMPAWLGTP